jgi:hypothetical protein
MADLVQLATDERRDLVDLLDSFTLGRWALAGRADALDELEGPGAAKLAPRLAV